MSEMSEEKGTYGTMEAEWPDPRASEDVSKEGRRYLHHLFKGPMSPGTEALIAFSILELADAIRDFPRLWLGAVANRSADGTFVASRKPGGIADP